MNKRTGIWIAVAAGVVCLAFVSCCCFTGMLGSIDGRSTSTPGSSDHATEQVPSPANPAGLTPLPQAPPPAPSIQPVFVPCPSVQVTRDPPPLLPDWVPDELKRRLTSPFAPIPLQVDGSPAVLEVVRDGRERAVGLRVDRWIDGRLAEGAPIALPSSARRAVPGIYRDADAAVGVAGNLGVVIHAESAAVFVLVDLDRGRTLRSTPLALSMRNRERPGRPRIAHGGGIYGVVVPVGFELTWFEITSEGRLARGPITLGARSQHPRVVWNGERFAVLGSPREEGDHTLALYEIAPGGDAPSSWRTLASSYDPSDRWGQRRYVVRGELLFAHGAYFVLASSWALSHRSPDHRFEIIRAGLDGSIDQRACHDPTR